MANSESYCSSHQKYLQLLSKHLSNCFIPTNKEPDLFSDLLKTATHIKQIFKITTKINESKKIVGFFSSESLSCGVIPRPA